MITIPTPSAEIYQAMASSSAKAATAAGKVMGNVQQGFLSCVTKVCNSLETLKNTVVKAFHRLSDMMKPSAAEAPVSPPIVTTLNSMSVDDTRQFCDQLKQNMSASPDAINGMFRQSPTLKLTEFNEYLKNTNDLLDKINNVDASFLVKKWMGQILSDNKFSVEERKMLVDHKDNRKEVNKILKGKFNSSDANVQENKAKFISLLSVMRAYKGLSLSNPDMKDRQHDISVIGLVGVPLMLDFNENTNSSEVSEAKTAFMALVDHCPPDLLPKPVRSVSVSN